MDNFGSYNARELELRSTLVFLGKSMTPIKVDLCKELISLKPYFEKEEVLEAVDELVEKGYLILAP